MTEKIEEQDITELPPTQIGYLNKEEFIENTTFGFKLMDIKGIVRMSKKNIPYTSYILYVTHEDGNIEKIGNVMLSDLEKLRNRLGSLLSRWKGQNIIVSTKQNGKYKNWVIE